jgi:hypothetical protein
MRTKSKRTHPEGLYIHLWARIFQEGKVHIARCDTLAISDQGRTKDEAIENLARTLGVFFLSCVKRDSIWRVLDRYNIAHSRAMEQPAPSADADVEEVPVRIPLELLAGDHGDSGLNPR